jgi:tRNA (cytidine/uridine-2'-O-)-methyltransferase
MSFNVVLFEPLIPQNTGTIARLTAATNSYLHLIEPLGFEISDRYLKRAGLDYWPWVKLTIHKDWEAFLEVTGLKNQICEGPANEPSRSERLFFFSARATKPYWEAKFEKGDYLVFGNEERGFPEEIHQQYFDQRFTLPMENPNVRSLNVACATSAILFDAIRQSTV